MHWQQLWQSSGDIISAYWKFLAKAQTAHIHTRICILSYMEIKNYIYTHIHISIFVFSIKRYSYMNPLAIRKQQPTGSVQSSSNKTLAKQQAKWLPLTRTYVLDLVPRSIVKILKRITVTTTIAILPYFSNKYILNCYLSLRTAWLYWRNSMCGENPQSRWVHLKTRWIFLRRKACCKYKWFLMTSKPKKCDEIVKLI